ncbi:enolase C-terminal domain-like protein [Corynebacterium xerosis]|uniref:enolase C-terminal domain-like protein n=1 Tax=Corynebacterium xerosis TaxID=1725 RepID=UPI0036705E27
MSAKIVKAEFFVTSPSRNFVILQLATGDGVIGVGGASRTGARAYGHASGTDLEPMFDSIRYEMELGYTMILVQTSVPGIEKLHGVAAQEQSSGARYDFVPANRTTPREAAQPAKSLEPYNRFWLEDVTLGENQENLRYVRQQSTTPLAIGEVFNTVYDIKDLINEQLIDYVRCATTHFGGITPLKKVMAQAEPYQIKSGFHGPTDVSPIGFAAELHLDINIHNCGAREYMTHTPETLEDFETTMTFENGMLHPSDTPGLGVTLHPEVAEKFPYEQAYLPYNRLADGTVHNW